jgi:hypothetical protein
MPDAQKPAGKEQETNTVVSKLSSLVGLYAIFVYVSGWTYLDYYYRSFGLYTRWIDISLPETLMKGFIILFEGGQCLWFIYLFIVVVPVLFEVFPQVRRYVAAQLTVALIMLACLPLTYYIAKSVGMKAAQRNKSELSALPEVSFTVGCRRYVGKLLFAKDGVYYIHDSLVLGRTSESDPKCEIPKTVPRQAGVHELELFRAEEVHGLTVTEY